MKHAFVRQVLTGMLSVLPLAGVAAGAAPANSHRVYPVPPDSPLAQLPVDPREKAHAPGRDPSGDAHRDRGFPPEWIRQRGTPVYDQATAIASSQTHVFTVGNSGDNLDGNTGAGAQDIFLMKHSLAGAHQWTRQLGSTAVDVGLQQLWAARRHHPPPAPDAHAGARALERGGARRRRQALAGAARGRLAGACEKVSGW